MYFLGIDASVRSSGIALLGPEKEDTLQYKLIETHSDCKGGRLLHAIYAEAKRFIGEETILCAIMEGPSYASMTKQFSMGEVYGIFKFLCFELDIDLKIASPTQLKKYLAGSATSTKEGMVRKAMSILGYQGTSDDIADALAAACLARDIYKKENTPGTRKSLEVIRSFN